MIINSTAGNIIEENHYYAYGLKIAAISSKKLGDVAEGKLSNPYLYNDKEVLDEDAGLNWYDYGFRSYDPQIGRFMQLDPLTDRIPILSPYLYAFDDPIANTDKNGLFGEGIIGGTAETAKTLASVTVHAVLPTGNKVFRIVDLANVVSDVGHVINIARTASDIINIKILTPPAGDNLSLESLSGNPDFSGVTLGALRGLVRAFTGDIDQFKINISAGILLEDLYQNFSGLTKNTKAFYAFKPNPNGPFPLLRKIIPDFLPGVQSGSNITSQEGGIAEVKAINNPITFSTSNYQVAAEGLVASKADIMINGEGSFGNP